MGNKIKYNKFIIAMSIFESITKENLHHANLVISNGDILDEILKLVERLGVKTSGNENFIFEQKNKFLIKDAKRIFDTQLRKTPEGELQIFILSFNFITREAQNSLLKMFEEPKERTHFFIIAPSENIFLETILSRVSVLEIQDLRIKIQESAKEFLKMNIGERIKFIAGLVKEIKDEKRTKQDAINLLSSLEIEINEKVKSQKSKVHSLKSVVLARKYINLSGASVKILLENVALSCHSEKYTE